MSKNKLTKEDIFLLREKFISEYSKKKNWNVKELSTNQMLEIISKESYKNPKIR